jgi:hypothetical protein
MGSELQHYVKYTVSLNILKGMGRTDSSLIVYILFENSKLKTTMTTLQFIAQFSAL